jgi:hypothetical protein
MLLLLLLVAMVVVVVVAVVVVVVGCVCVRVCVVRKEGSRYVDHSLTSFDHSLLLSRLANRLHKHCARA